MMYKSTNVTGEDLSSSFYFLPAEPASTGLCGRFQQAGADVGWASADCHQQSAFICQLCKFFFLQNCVMNVCQKYYGNNRQFFEMHIGAMNIISRHAFLLNSAMNFV